VCNMILMKKIFQECYQGKASENREALLKILEGLSAPVIGAAPSIPQLGLAIGASPNIPKVGQKRAGNGAATGYSTEDDSCDEQEGVVAVKKPCSAQGSELVNANHAIDAELVSSMVANTKELLILRPKWIELRKTELDMESKARQEEVQAVKAKMDMEAQAAKARDEERAKELEFLRAKAKIEADARVAVQVSAPVDIPVPQPKTLWTIKEVALKEGIIKYLQRAIQNRILAIVGKHFHGRASPTEKVVEGNLLVYQYHMSLYDEIKAELQKTCDNICNPAGQTKLSFARAE